MKATIKGNGTEYKYDRLESLRVKDGKLTIGYVDESDEYHEETSQVPEYFEVYEEDV